MSKLSTLLAWLIPCLVIFIAFIAWRIYIYRTRGPTLPTFLRQNVFARTRSFSRTPSISSINNEIRASHTPATAIRNETRVDMSNTQMSSTPPSALFAPVPFEKKPLSSTQEPSVASTPGTIPSNESSPPPVSPAITRLLNMK